MDCGITGNAEITQRSTLAVIYLVACLIMLLCPSDEAMSARNGTTHPQLWRHSCGDLGADSGRRRIAFPRPEKLIAR
jgi:hypothetical protein